MAGKSRKSVHIVLFVASAFVLLGGVIANMPSAAAQFISEEEHWKYNMHWSWKPSLRKSVGIIDSQIIIQNETADRVEGYVADANGTRITVYNDEQVVMVKYVYDSPIAVGSDWEIGGKTNEGFFAIDIPEKYRDAETLALYIGSNSYRVDTDSLPKPLVLINPIRTDYRTNSTLDLTEAQTIAAAQGEDGDSQQYSGNSLIDRILQQVRASSI